MKGNYIKFGYLLWVITQMVMLMIGGNIHYRYFGRGFFPWDGEHWDYSYDLSEFLFYTIVPVLIYKAIVLLRPEPTKEDE